MPRGVPKITVTYEIDADGVLTVSAKETSTGACKATFCLLSADRLACIPSPARWQACVGSCLRPAPGTDRTV